MKKPQVIAHRGLRMELPENTLPSIKAALPLGAQGIEFDVDLTKDNVPVILHQRTITPGENNELQLGDNSFARHWVQDITWEEISTYDAGSWFSEEFKDIRVPTFKEVLELDWERLIDLGVDGIITDFPKELLRMLPKD